MTFKTICIRLCLGVLSRSSTRWVRKLASFQNLCLHRIRPIFPFMLENVVFAKFYNLLDGCDGKASWLLWVMDQTLSGVEAASLQSQQKCPNQILIIVWLWRRMICQFEINKKKVIELYSRSQKCLKDVSWCYPGLSSRTHTFVFDPAVSWEIDLTNNVGVLITAIVKMSRSSKKRKLPPPLFEATFSIFCVTRGKCRFQVGNGLTAPLFLFAECL